MVLVKIRNAAELLWDSLDSQERLLVGYVVGYVALLVFCAYARRSRENLKRELMAELAATGASDGR